MLKNSDGTPYKLTSFNKLVATQDNLDPKNVVKHNFEWSEQDLGESTGRKPPIKKYAEPIIPQTQSEITKPEVKAEVKPEVKPEVIKPEVKPDLSEFNPVMVHCLPWGITRTTNFYGDTIMRDGYLAKFSFEAIIFKDDVEIVLWTNATKIEAESIIYPSKYINDNSPYASYNWWKIIESKAEKGGYLLRGIPSETKPDFT